MQQQPAGQKPRNVCVVSEVEFGSTAAADPASATYALAQYLAKTGDTVTLLWVPSPFASQPDEQEIAKLAKWCFDNFLVRLEILPGSPDLLRGLESSDQNSVAVYHYLKQNSFDVVYFALEGGLAHFPTVAKRTGVFPDPPVLIVLAHEPLMWKLEANARAIDRKEQMTVTHMERTAVETCDHLIVTGQTLLDWMTAAGWKLPASRHIATPLEPEEWRSNFVVDSYRPRGRPAAELVHFSGTEPRRGLTLFCDALDRLADSGVTDLAVTVIGAFGHVLGEHSGGMVVRRARQWPFRLKLLPIREESEILRYLRQSHALVAITHSAAQLPLDVLACLDEEIPFVATDVGSIRGLLQPKSADDVMMEASPSAIAAKIASVLESRSFGPAKPLHNRNAREKDWSKLHAKLCRQPAKAAGPPRSRKRPPLVSIITAHYNRARFLPQAIASVRRQDYPNIELIVVDDGSTDPEAIRLLAELEPEFQERGWRIIRQKNGFLGKARNTGIRAAKGALVLFLDDDNALFPNAVSTLAAALQKTGADICTTFSKWLNEPFVPPDTKSGYMLYFPVGGPADIALITNPYGDANAMFRREVFDKIGYLNEERGFSASDWEFFLRADLAGLEIVTVPEPLYWYRSSPTGMNRNAEWLRNRRPIINVFRKHKFAHTDMFVQLGISSNTANHEKDLNLWNLELRVRDDRYLRLSSAPAASTEAIQLLAEIAAREGRPDTAISLLAHTGRSDFTQNVAQVLDASIDETAPELHSSLHRQHYLSSEPLRLANVGSYPDAGANLLSYVEQSPDQLFLEARDGNVAMALLNGVCPPGCIGASCWIYLDEDLTAPAQFQLAVIDAENQSFSDMARILESGGGTGWIDVGRPHEAREIRATVEAPATERRDLLLALRSGGDRAARVLGGFAAVQIHYVLSTARRPRLGAPQERQRMRRLTGDELKRAVLATDHPSDLPTLLVAGDNGGLFLRPNTHGPVVAALKDAFPAFARSAIATVEIAHEEASPFEFAMALGRPEERLIWNRDTPVGAVAFSGWTRVTRPFELHDLKVSIPEIDRKWLTIYLAIRLPRGSKPMPSNAFWRKLLLTWD